MRGGREKEGFAMRMFGRHVFRFGRTGGRDGTARYGKRIRAEVLGTAPEPSTVTGPDPGGVRYVLVCGYVDPGTGKEYRFRAGGLDWEGRLPLPGSQVTVYVDPDSDYQDYEIDLISLW